MNEDEEQLPNLTVEQCEELAKSLFEDASVLRPGSEKDALEQLAQAYRNLAQAKRLVKRNVN